MPRPDGPVTGGAARTYALPGGSSTTPDYDTPGELAPVTIPIAATHDLILVPAKYGLTFEVVVAGNNQLFSVDYDIVSGAVVVTSATGSTGNVTTHVGEVEIELRKLSSAFTTVFATGVVSTKDEIIQEVATTSLDPPPLVSPDDDVTWSTLRPHAEELFQNDGCIDVARFHIEADWLVSAAEIEAQWEAADENATIAPELTVASRLLQRRLSQWLTIHAFVARDAAQTDKMRTVMELENQPDTTPIPLDDAFDAMEQGLSLILYPQYFDVLANMPGAWLADPDYRVSTPSSSFADHHEQGLGLPVVLLDTVAAYLELGNRYLDTVETDIFLESLTSSSRDAREALMARFGRMMRYALAVQSLANGLYAKAQQYADDSSTELPWAEDWKHAREKTGATLNKLAAHMNRVLSGQNPLGISDDDLPIYFVDPQTTNQRFFASSDYLLQTWAIPAVSRADSRLDAARQAEIAKQDSEVRQLLTEQDHTRRTRDLTSHYGGLLRTACGLDIPAAEAFEQYRRHEIDLSTCQYVPSDVNPQCAEQFERIWESTNSQNLMEMLTSCGPEAMAGASRNIYDARRKLCTLIRVAADSRRLDLNSHINKSRLNPFAYWDYGSPDTRFSDIRNGADGGPSIASIRATLEDYAHYGNETFESYIGARTDWPLLDEAKIGQCGTEFDLPDEEFEPSTYDPSIEEINTWFSRVSIALAWSTGDGENCNVPTTHECRGLTTDEALLKRFGPPCDIYLASQPYPSDLMTGSELENAFFDPEQLAECYRGTLAEFELGVLSARQQLREALSALHQIQSSYDTTARSCIMIAQLNQNLGAAMDAHYKTTQSISETSKAVESAEAFIVSALTENPTAFVTNFADAVGDLFGLDDKQAKVDHQFQMVSQQIKSSTDALQCWTQADQAISGYRTQVESVRSVLLNVSTAHVRRKNQLVELAAQLSEGDAVIADEKAMFAEIPNQRHSYWYDEKLDRFDTDFAWAKRLTYLAMLAAEYELQQSFDLRKLILDAAHPMELEEAIRQIEQQQATRGINGRRPESKTFVRSLRDETLNLFDSSGISSQDADGLRKIPAVNRWLDKLMSTASSVFSSDGEYLGQGIPFNLAPDDALHYRCAERMWSVSAALQGDLLGVIEPQLPVFLLKRNTFASQWCDGRGPIGEQFQTGSLRPSVNLFVDSSSAGQSNEAEAYSWGFIDAWINVKRKDFYSEHYTEGASDELAGRGLYGDYMLLIPYKGFIDQGVPLGRIEDVLLKFDYVSVDNGGSLGNPPPGYDELPFDPGIVHDLQETLETDKVTLTWKPSRAPIATGTYAVYRDGELLDDAVTSETYEDTAPASCGVYMVSVIDTYGDILPGVSVKPECCETWSCSILRTDSVVDAKIPGGLTGIDSQTGVFSVALLLWKQSAATHSGSWDRSWAAMNNGTIIAQFMTTPPSGGSDGGTHFFSARFDASAGSTLYLDTDSLTLQVAEIDRVNQQIRVSTVAPDGTTTSTPWKSTAGAGTFLPGIDMYLLSVNSGAAVWGGSDPEEGLIGAVVFDGLLSGAQWVSLAQGAAPWDVVDPTDVLRAYSPGSYHIDGGVVYLNDLASQNGGLLDPIDAELRNGDGTLIEPR